MSVYIYISIYRLCDKNEEEFELLEKVEVNGAVEGVSFAKVRKNLLFCHFN